MARTALYLESAMTIREKLVCWTIGLLVVISYLVVAMDALVWRPQRDHIICPPRSGCFVMKGEKPR